MVLLLAILVILSLLALAVARWLTGGSDTSENRIELILSGDSFSDRYRPMERLLCESDWKFLSTQPGFTSSRIREIRAKRRNLFRRYLNCVNGDFGAMCVLVRALMVQSATDRPDLARALFRIRVSFFYTLLKIQLRLAAHAVGVPAIHIDVQALTSTLEQIGSCARSLQLAAEPSPA